MRDLDALKNVDFSKAALLVIDMQNDFVHPDGANGRWIRQRWAQDGDRLGEFGRAVEKMLRSTRELVEICRGNRVPVIWIRVVLNDATDCRFWREEGYVLCREGHWGSEWYDGFGPRADEVEILKTRHSAFHKTRLQEVLQELRCETLLLAGTATHGCVEGTARDAMANDYWVVVAGEACGQLDMEAHQQALVRINRLFGYVLDVPAISQALKNAA